MPAHKYTPEECISVFWSKVDKSGGDNACWLWTAGFTSRGYGSFLMDDRTQSTHRVAWQLTYGTIPDSLFVLHNCPDGDNPACVNPSHLWLGTSLDNARDRDRKGRGAKGERAGVYTHPESRTFGERNGQRRHPERTVRGDSHWTRIHPENIVRSYGDANGSRKHPEKMPRGENHKNSKLTDAEVIDIRNRYAQGGITQRALAKEFSISQSVISLVIQGRRGTTINE